MFDQARQQLRKEREWMDAAKRQKLILSARLAQLNIACRSAKTETERAMLWSLADNCFAAFKRLQRKGRR